MATRLERWLTLLVGISKKSCPSKDDAELAADTLKNFVRLFEFDDVSEDAEDLAYAELFDEETGILKFIHEASLQEKCFEETIKTGFELILYLVQVNRRNKTKKYALQIEEFCWKFWKSKKLASLKENSLKVLVLLYDSIPPETDGSQLNARVGDLMNAITQGRKPTKKVLQLQFHLLGIVCHKYPEKIQGKSEGILRVFLHWLEQQGKGNAEEWLTVLKGHFDGLSEFLHSFPLRPDDLSKQTLLHDVIKTRIGRRGDKYRESHRAALNLLSLHGSQFSKQLMDDCVCWHKRLWGWVASDESNDSKAGKPAFDNFYRVISTELLQIEAIKGKDKYQKLKDELGRGDDRAVVAFGYLSAAAKVLLGPYEVSELFSIVKVQINAKFFRRPGGHFPSSVRFLPAYMETMSRITRNMEHVTLDQVIFLQEVTVHLIENFPACPLMQKDQCTEAVITVTHHLITQGLLVHIFLENVFYQGLIRSCSFPLETDVGLLKEQCSDGRNAPILTCCIDYVPFWQELFNISNAQKYLSKGSDGIFTYQHTIGIMFDHFISSILMIFHRLDLTVKKEYSVGVEGDEMNRPRNEFGLRSSKPLDQVIFCNLVSIICKVFSKINQLMEEKCLNHFTVKIIDYSERLPLISGFYKVLGSCLHIYSSLKYFEETETSQIELVGANSFPEHLTEKGKMFTRLKQFLLNMLQQMRRYKDDLKVSCLQVVLATPTPLIRDILPHLVSTMKSTFEIGCSYHPLADAGIRALEKWTQKLPLDEWDTVLRQILPSLDSFLKSGEDNVIETATNLQLNKISKASSSRRKFIVAKRKLESRGRGVDLTTLHQIQRRALLFLGQLPPSTALALAGDEHVEHCMAWDVECHLPFKIPMPDMNPSIYIDKFLPRTMELSLTSSNRETRMMASQLLHSFVMYFLGRGVPLAHKNEDALSKLLEKLAPGLIQLGCNSDDTVKDLFYQLSLQLSRWYSTKLKLQTKDSNIWIRALLNGLCDPQSAAIRELCASCMEEFVNNVLNSDEIENKSCHETVEKILEKICALCLHSSLYKRIGASLALNRLYPALKKVDFFVEKLWFELLYHQVLGIEMCDLEGVPSDSSMSTSLENLEQVLNQKSAVFNKPSKIRQKPPGFQGVLLKDLLFWLLQKTGSVGAFCREECMKLFLNLAPCVEGCTSPEGFITKFVVEAHGFGSIIRICEGEDRIPCRPQWTTSKYHSDMQCSSGDLLLFLEWMKLLFTSLHCYVWIFENKLAQPHDIFKEEGNHRVFEAVSDFLSSLENFDDSIYEALARRSLSPDAGMGQAERKVFLKPTVCGVSVQMFKFFSCLHGYSSSNIFIQNLLHSFLTPRLGDLIANLISKENIRDSHESTINSLQLALRGLFKVIESLPAALNEPMFAAINMVFQKKPKAIIEDVPSVLSGDAVYTHVDFVKSLLLLDGCLVTKSNSKLTYLDQLKERDILSRVFGALFTTEGSQIICVPLNQAKVAYLESLLQLSLRLNPQTEFVIELMINDTKVTASFSQTIMTKGEHFYMTFKQYLMMYLILDCKCTLESLLEQLKHTKEGVTPNIIVNILKDLLSDKRMEQRQREEPFLSSCLSQYWPALQRSAETVEWTRRVLDLLLAICVGMPGSVEILRGHSKVIPWCLGVLVSKDSPFNDKAKVLQLLCWFVCQNNEGDFRRTLSDMRDHHFPFLWNLSSKDRRPLDSDLEMTLEMLLKALKFTGSPMLMDFFVYTSKGGNIGVNEQQLDECLTVLARSVDSDQQQKLISAAYSVAVNGGEIITRLGAVKIFISKLIKNGDENAVISFYKEKIKNINETLRRDLKDGAKDNLRCRVVSKIVCFKLVELMFDKLKTKLEEPDCPIALFDKDGKLDRSKMIKILMTRCLKARVSLNEWEEGQEDLFRQYRCAAYNAVVSLVMNLKWEGKAYKYLLQENVSFRDGIWEGLVDTSTTLHLPRAFDKIPEIAIVEAPNFAGEESMKMENEWSGSLQSSVRLTTQEFLADSTLNDDITKFDYQHCSVKSSCKTMAGFDYEKVMKGEGSSGSSWLIHEKDPAGDHECMVTVTCLIMSLLKLEPQDFCWMNFIKEAIEFRDGHNNVKIFLVRVMLNCEKELAKHAKDLIAPVMELIGRNCLGNDINYLIIDVIQMLVLWYKNNPDISLPRVHVTGMFNCFALKAEEDKQQIFKENCEIIRLMFETWKDLIDIPYDAIQGKITRPVSQKLGLSLSSILLDHSKTPWRPEDKNRFLDSILKIFQKGDDQVSLKSAEVIGKVLRMLDPENTGTNGWDSLDQDDRDFVHSVINHLQETLKKKEDSFLNKINKIQENYICIANEFVMAVLFCLPNLKGKFQSIAMNIVCSQVENLERPFMELKDKGLLRWLTTNNPENQETALKMVLKILPKLQEDEIHQIWDCTSSFHSHSSAGCRKVMYEILMWIFDNYCQEEWEQTPGASEEEVDEPTWSEKYVKALVLGLVDGDKDIQSRVSSFFEGKSGLRHSDPTPERFVKIMDKLYNGSTEGSFLGYTLSFLCSSSASTPLYKEKLFEVPLADCEFQDYSPRDSHTTQHLTMSPMFADSFASSLTQSDSRQHSQNSASMSARHTAIQRSLAFSVAPGTPWVSSGIPLFSIGVGSSQDTVDFRSASTSHNLPDAEGFKRPLPKQYSRKRHLSHHRSKSYYAAVENRRSAERIDMEEERKKKRGAKLTWLRKFRTGAFPDIQICYAALLDPLFAVAKRDSVIAKQLFVSLYNGMLNELRGSEGRFSMLALQSREAFKRILKDNNQICNATVSAVMEIALSRISTFPLDVDSVICAIGPSKLSPLACLFLEARLNQWHTGHSARPYDRSHAEKDKKIWLQLTMLYQGMEEYDVVHGIFHDVMGCGPAVKKALEYERSGQWTKGKAAFKEMLSSWTENDDCLGEMDYYYEGYFKCLANLSQWKYLNKEVMKQLDNSFSEAWSDTAFWMPWLLKSKINYGLEEECSEAAFYEYITECLQNKEKRTYLEGNYQRELALVHAMFGQYDRAGRLSRKYCDSFLKDWIHLSSLSTKIKGPKLMDTMLLAELSLFLSAMKSHESRQCNEDYQKLCDSWKVNLPNCTESLSHWEHRVACRNLYIRKMTPMDIGSPSAMDEDAIKLENISAKMTLSLVEMAIAVQNFQVAENYLRKSEGKLKKHADPTVRIPWNVSWAFLPCVKGLGNQNDTTSQLTSCVEAWGQLMGVLNDPQLSFPSEMKLKSFQRVITVSKTVHTIIKTNPSIIDNVDDDIKSRLFKLIGDSVGSVSSVVERVSTHVIDRLEKSVRIAEDLTSSQHSKLSQSYVADQYLELAKYCQYLLEDSSVPEIREKTCMTAILRAMAYGSQQAQQWFPCILQFSGLYTSLSDCFKTESSRVPAWMFLGWTNQILAHLKCDSCSTLSDLIVRLAETYPAAVVFPFKVSCAKFQQENSEALLVLMKRLQELTKNPLLERMLQALPYVCVPSVMLDYHLVRIKSLLDSLNPVRSEVEEAHSLMMSEAFPIGRGKRVIGPQNYGEMIQRLQSFETEVRRVKGKLYSVQDKKQIEKELHVIRQRIKSEPSQKAPLQLKKYSEWLSEFRSSGRGDFVEIPGQYTGECEPRVQEHVKIVGFLPKVAVMNSMRKPICVTILGSDAKEYKFLIKYGEDLRLDQRIQQLFGIMNKILTSNLATKERKVRLETYQVIPLTSHLGVIEWVDNTLPLTEMYSLLKEQKIIDMRNMSTKKYIEWFSKASQGSCQPKYTDVYHTYGRETTVKYFKERVDAFPCDILRRALLKCSQTLESFWSLRSAFATSHAALCIAHWLLGIGDRHNANTLVSMVTGRAIGIDFGYSFGAATHILALPELMPFRLTPQIMGLMQPFGEAGLLKETMIHTLRALQENHDILLATMDVFVQEPSVDWLDHARKMAKKAGISLSESEENEFEFVKQKVALMRRKFVGGTNPREITLEELGTRGGDARWLLSKMKEVARGDPKHNVRATLPSEGLSCEQQVSCLIDQATDYHVLGKTWYGWEPYL